MKRRPAVRCTRFHVCLTLATTAVGFAAAANRTAAPVSAAQPPSDAFPITYIGGGKPYVPYQARYSYYGEIPHIQIESVSDDGKWAYLTVRDAQPDHWFFDVEKRQFVGHITDTYDRGSGYRPLLHRWRPDSMLVEYHESRPLPAVAKADAAANRPPGPPQAAFAYRTRILEVDALTRRCRVLSEIDAGPILVGPPMGGPEAFTNTQHSRIAFSHHGRDARNVWDLASSERHTIPRKAFEPKPTWPTGLEFLEWLPDGATMLFRDFSAEYGDHYLYLVPTDPEQPISHIDIAALFSRLRQKGLLSPDEDKISHMTLLQYPDGGKTARLFVLFACPSDSRDAEKRDFIWAQDRDTESSIWDLNLETQELKRVMSLGRNAVRRKQTIFSPSGTSALDVLTGRTAKADTNRVYPTRPVFYTVGKPRPQLALELPLPGTAYSSFHAFYVNRYVRFLDDHTLLYVGQNYSLWTFDIRSNRSEQIWRMDVEKTERPPATKPPGR